MFGYIYKTTNLVNDKIYIGKKHKSEFVPSYYGSGKILKRAIEKYGVDNFTVEVIEWCETLEELNVKERYYINVLNSETHKGKGYNIALGGDGGNLLVNMSKEDREKFINDCRERSIGEKNPNYGNGDKLRGDKNPSKRPEVRKRLSETSSGEGNGMYGVTGDNHPMYGKHMSEKSKEKMRETRKNKKPVEKICIYCNESFYSAQNKQKYCSTLCRGRKYRDNKKK